MSDSDRSRQSAAFDQGLFFLEDYLEKGQDSFDLGRSHKDPRPGWSLGLTARITVSLSALLHLAETSDVWDLTTDIKDRLYSLFETVYSALLVKVYNIEVLSQSSPFDPVATAVLSGNEISHWPGVDVGLVAWALLRGRYHFRLDGLFRRQPQLGHLEKEIFGTCRGDDKLPIDLPIFTSTMNLLKRQIVGYHNEELVRGALHATSPVISGDFTVLGACLASASVTQQGDSRPVVYLWATAHCLLALVEHYKSSKELADLDRCRQKTNLISSKLSNAERSLDLVTASGRISPKWMLVLSLFLIMFYGGVHLAWLKGDSSATTTALDTYAIYLLSAACLSFPIGVLSWTWFVFNRRVDNFCSGHADVTERRVLKLFSYSLAATLIFICISAVFPKFVLWISGELISWQGGIVALLISVVAFLLSVHREINIRGPLRIAKALLLGGLQQDFERL